MTPARYEKPVKLRRADLFLSPYYAILNRSRILQIRGSEQMIPLWRRIEETIHPTVWTAVSHLHLALA